MCEHDTSYGPIACLAGAASNMYNPAHVLAEQHGEG